MKQAVGGPASLVIEVADESQIGEARRAAASLASHMDLNETERGALALVVTEAATNLARHAKGGMLALRSIGSADAGGVEVLALDKGPGIRDLSRAMTDGYSTGGTAGQGLGAIRRMATEFDLMSSPTSGTVLLARLWSAAGQRAQKQQSQTDGVVCTPVGGEFACGDGWVILHTPGRSLVVIADGLGHGSEAAKAADEALRIVRERQGDSPAQIIQAAHGPLRATRGAAMAVAEILSAERIVRFAGVGNISGAVLSGSSARSMASHNGTVGHSMRKVQEFTYPWPTGACLFMHSDGIMSRWRLDAYPGLATRHPALVAGVFYRDFLRGRDDATTLAVRDARQEAGAA